MTLLAEGVESILTLEQPMIGIKKCVNPECGVEFVPTRHNQKYCNKDCRSIVTNAKTMERYFERKDREAGKKRLCIGCGITPLSRYNEGKVCQSCLLKERAAVRSELLQMIGEM